ncbi:MAG: PEP-CTERM sorting domain-containing protein [Candidatus Acidiferrales bacterium]
MKSIVRSASLLALLVLALSVTGAFADGVTSNHTAVTLGSIQTLSMNGGAQSAYWVPTSLASLFPMSLPNAPVIAIIPNPKAPVSATPEPATVYLFLLGTGLILFGMKRRVAES